MRFSFDLGLKGKSGTFAPPAAPTVSGTINNQSLQQGTSVVTYLTSGAFTGSSLTYSLTGGAAGITINPSTGVVSVDRAVVAVNVFSLTVRATNVSGFAQTGFTLTVTAASATANSVSQGSVTFPFTGAARVVGNSFDGAAYIVVPDGGTVEMAAPTPAVSSVTLSSVTYATNGVSVNPMIQGISGYLHPFDQRIAYSAVNLATFPRTLAIGDIVVKAISNPTVGQANRREGVIDEYAVCHVISESQFAALPLPASQMLSPTPFSWAGRTTKIWRPVDMDALFALRPNLPLAGVAGMPTISTIVNRFNRFNIGLNASYSTTESGYEGHCLNRYGSPTGGNYGASLAEAMRIVSLAFLGDTPRATIEAAIRRFVSIGSWWFDQEEGKGTPQDGDGGHWNFHLTHMIFGLLATGRSARVADIGVVSPQNHLSQSFLMDSTRQALLAPHSSASLPYTYLRRAVSVISGSNITVATTVGPTHMHFYGLECRKSSDNSLIGYATNANSSSGAATYVVTLDRAAAGLTVSDEVYFAAPSGWYDIGEPSWTLTNATIALGFKNWNPSPTPTYSTLNCWAGEALLVRGLGLYSTQFEAMEKLVKRQVFDTLPSAMIGATGGQVYLPSPFPVQDANHSTANYQSGHGQYVKNFWDAHHAALGLSNVQTVALTPSTWPASHVIPHLGSTARAYGNVPLAGTGTPGAIIQARAYDSQFTGLNTTAWQTVSTVDGAGNWSAAWQCPMTPFWALPEVRVSGNDATIQRGATQFSVGLVLAMDGQSQIATGFSNTYNPLATRPVVTASNDVFVASFDNMAGNWVTETAYAFTNSLPAHIANYFAQVLPNVKVKVGYFARSGTGPDQLLDDANAGRSWADNVTIFNAVTNAGAVKPSVLSFYWLGNTTVFGNNFGNFFSEILTQKRLNGTSFALPSLAETTKADGGTVNLDHTYAELFGDWSDSKVLNGTFVTPMDYYANHEALKASWVASKTAVPHFNAILDNSPFFIVAPHSLGRPDGGGGFTDQLHPSNSNFAGTDGGIRFHKSMIDGMLRAAGLMSTPNIIPNTWTVAGDGTYAELGATGYTFNSLWGLRSETPPAGLRKAIGVSVNGQIPYDADYVAGKLRVYAPPGTPFTGANYFGIDNVPSHMNALDTPANDGLNHYWKAYPHIAPVGGTGLDATVVNMVDTPASLLVNNLPSPAPIMVNQAVGDGTLTAASVTASTGTKLVFAARFNSTAILDSTRVIELAGVNPCDIYVNAVANNMQVRVRSGAVVLYQATYPINRALVKNHIVTVDALARVVKVYELDGTELVGAVVALTPIAVATAWTAATYQFNAGQVRLFNSSALNRSLMATTLGQVVIAVDTTLVDLGGANEIVDIHNLSTRMTAGSVGYASSRAQVVIGDQTPVASWNTTGAFNTGTGPNTGWSLSGTFAAA